MASPRIKSLLVCVAAGWICGCSAFPDEPAIVISGATLIDGSSQPPIMNSVLVVRGQQIAGFGGPAAVEVPKRAVIIDAAGKFVFPLTTTDRLRVGGPASFLLLPVNPALDPEFEKKVVGRMVDGRWTIYPQ